MLRFILLFTVTAAAAFSPRPSFVNRRCSSTTDVQSKAEDHLEDFKDVWADLQRKEKELEKSRDETKAIDFAEELLENAVDYVHTLEEIEADHIKTAHDAVVNAVEQERALENYAHTAHDDATAADSVLNTCEELEVGENVEIRREEAIAELAHNVEEYAESRLDEAHLAELAAREKEEEAEKAMKQLELNEQMLKDTLAEFKALKKEKSLKQDQ